MAELTSSQSETITTTEQPSTEVSTLVRYV